MDIKLDTDTLGPDQLGETLRLIFFPPQIQHTHRYGDVESLGCYSSFEHIEATDLTYRHATILWQTIFEASEDDPQYQPNTDDTTERTDEAIQQGEQYTFNLNGTPAIAAWYWDGDGCLLFAIPGRTIINNDCKKTHGWTDIKLPASIYHTICNTTT